MLLYIEREEGVKVESREVQLAMKYLNIWKGEDKLVSLKQNIENDMETFCSLEMRKAVQSCVDAKHFVSRKM